ncbi:MAG: hypothetical protein P4L84_11985 [Isosphaeraceae bacterium]|nr:hypothetical protein [Isosphaeraceae bacterium]
MTDPVAPPLTLPELERIVHEADPSALLVAPRILRRVIKKDRGVTFLGWHGAHRESYSVAGATLDAIVDPSEVGLPPVSAWPEMVSLLVRPTAAELIKSSRSAVLARYWRMLFRTRVHGTLEQRRRTGALDDGALRRRIEQLGRLRFEEARSVLRQDGRLLPPRDDRSVYCEFAAAFLELRCFAPTLLSHEFPAIDDEAGVERVLAEDVDGPKLLWATRLAGAPDPAVSSSQAEANDEGEEYVHDAAEAEPPEDAYRRRARRAEAAATRGNYARAAILWTQAAIRGGPAVARRARATARAEIDRLARRLQPAVGFDDAELDRWKRALPRLLDRSARGFWTAEARLIYDLQKVANDHQHEVFTVDLVEWVRSQGRRPLKRALPDLRAVMVSNHLHRAMRRLPATRLPRDARERLGVLLTAAVARVENELRERFRPVIEATLAQNDVRPQNLPERVAYHKLIDELLDRIVDRGFLTLGDLRDTFSRSHVKLPDLSGLSEFARGDRLLRIDSALAEALDGVYRRGEVYLRALQRASALAFGTRWGRFLTLYLALPYGGTFVGLKGLGHLFELLGVEVNLADPLVVLPLGTLALALVNSPSFRAEFLARLGRIGRIVKASAEGVYRWFSRLPWVRALLQSRLFTLVWRFVLKPLAVSIPFCAVGRLAGLPWLALSEAEGGVFVLFSLVLNSRLGRDAEEILAESAARFWKRLWFDLVPGLYRWVLIVFQQCLEAVERFLYAVDEWLRFRSGQPRGSLVAKAAFGFVWFFVAYLVRFYVNLLIEPQVNPIKHFPVVTVSHKIILPLSKTLTFLIAAPLMPLGKVVAYFIAGVTVLLLPGVFGFLVWEMKENWRLYEANRAESLRPVIVGDHGETMSRLLRPGFHSGTVPKLFARLRRAERKVLAGEGDNRVPRRLEALHHAAHEVTRFLERDFLGLLRECRLWTSPAPEVRSLTLATNRIRVCMRLNHERDDFVLTFEEDAGSLAADVSQAGWLARLSDAHRRACLVALVGLCKMSGVNIVRPPLGEILAPAFPELTASTGGSFEQIDVPWIAWVRAWQHDSPTGHDPTSPPHVHDASIAEIGGLTHEDLERVSRR